MALEIQPAHTRITSGDQWALNVTFTGVLDAGVEGEVKILCEDLNFEKEVTLSNVGDGKLKAYVGVPSLRSIYGPELHRLPHQGNYTIEAEAMVGTEIVGQASVEVQILNRG